MSDERFPYLNNFLNPPGEMGAKSDKTLSEEFSALLAPEGLVRPGENFSSGERDTGGLLEEFQHGEVSQNRELSHQVQLSISPASQEHMLTCFECPLHEHDPINPSQGWGRCTLRNQGCYGLKPACTESRYQNAVKARLTTAKQKVNETL